MSVKVRGWLIISVVMVLCCGRLLAQDEDRIQQIIYTGIQLVTLQDELLAPDFSTAEGIDGWYTADTERRFLGADDDAYRIEHSTRNSPIRGLYNEDYENTVLVVETTQLSEENDNGYGVVCRADPDVENSGYYFYINGEGSARIFTYENFTLRDLVDWTPIANINAGQATNEIIVVCANTYLALFVNGELAAETTSDLYPTGQIGFSATTYVSETTVSIAYENLQVFEASGGASELDEEFPAVLQNYGAGWQDAIAELQEEGVIDAGGELIFTEDVAFMESYIGSYFNDLARNTTYADVVFGGEVTVTLPNRGTTYCGFMSRVQYDEVNGVASDYFEVVVRDNEVITVHSTYQDTGRSRNIGIPLEPGMPIHILYVLQGNRATVYINGELLLANLNVADVTGFHGILLYAEAAGGRCEGRNIWAYHAPVIEAGVCEAVASGDVNRRTGPGTNYPRAGVLADGTSLLVTGQALGTDGFVWWRLENNRWVREDVVDLAGDCDAIPEVN